MVTINLILDRFAFVLLMIIEALILVNLYWLALLDGA